MASDIQSFFGSEKDYYKKENRDQFHEERLKLLFEKITGSISKNMSIIEIGCGVGELGIALIKSGYNYHGTDFSDEMINSAKENLKLAGIENGDYFDVVDLFDLAPETPYDVVIANGVICYYEDQPRFLKKIQALTSADAQIFISHRNELFNIFALNSGTLDFFDNYLLVHLEESTRKKIIKDLRVSISGLDTPVQKASNAVLFRSAENPLVVDKLYDAEGFTVEKISYTYIHPNPPRINHDHDQTTYNNLQKKYANSWEGMFLGSQFLIHARKNS